MDVTAADAAELDVERDIVCFGGLELVLLDRKLLVVLCVSGKKVRVVENKGNGPATP